MKMKSHFVALLLLFATSSPLLSATEVERLRALCAEQELQIAQLEEKIARLTDTPPPARKQSAVSDTTPASPSAERTYVVKSGDNIVRIARDHGTTSSAIAKLNGIKTSSIIHPGQKLRIPAAGGNSESQQTATVPAPTPARTHTIVAGDTFYSISRKYGVSVNDLTAANPNVNPQALRLGQKLKISSGTSQSAASKPAPSLASTPSVPVANKPASEPKPEPKRQTSEGPIKIEKEITYGEFAKSHGTTTDRLDQLNGLELDPSTVLAQGSELYIPAQP